MRVLFVLAAVVLIAAVQTAEAQRIPITVEADSITYDSVQQVVTAEGNVRVVARRHRVFADAVRYDLQAETVLATGRVRVIDDRGRLLRGQSLRYHIRTEEGVLEPSEGVIDPERRVFIRADQVAFATQRVIAERSFVTTCDPRRPLLHVTARRIEIVPNEQLVAHDASVFLRGRRLYTTRRFVVSLVPGEEGVLVPGFGYNDVDGYWADYRLRVRMAGAHGLLQLKYGTDAGAYAYLTLARQDPGYVTTLRLGRTQAIDDRKEFNLQPYTVAEVAAESTPRPIPGTPLTWTLRGAAGWFDERVTGVATTRLEAQVAVRSRELRLASNLLLESGASFRVRSFGIGGTQTLASVDIALHRDLAPGTRLTLAYTYRGIGGVSPLALDFVDPESSVSLRMVRAVRDRYRFAGSVAYNMLNAQTTLIGAASYVLSPSVEVGVRAEYKAAFGRFEDVDYYVRGICDCVDVVVRYRQLRREVSVEFGLLGFSERRAPFVPRSPLRPFVPEDGDVSVEGGSQH